MNARQALMSVTFRFEHRPDLAIELVVDTGFAGHLALPSSAVEALRLPFVFNSSARLANDSVIDVGVYAATIVWHGEEHSVDVLATGARPLLGTLLLDGFELNVQFVEGGVVSVESL